MFQTRTVGSALLFGTLLCCDSPVAGRDPSGTSSFVPSPPPITTVDSSALSGAALAAWQPDGRFHVDAPRLDPILPIMSGSQAERVLASYVKTWAVYFSQVYASDRGGPVNVAALEPCGPALYAESTLQPPDDSLAMGLRAHNGSKWLQWYCRDTTVVLSTSVGAYATALTDSGRSLPVGQDYYDVLSNAIWTEGVRISVRPPIHAEEAAARVHEATGRRIVTVPRLVLPRTPRSPAGALWLVELDSAVTVRGRVTGTTRSRRYFWYGAVPPTLAVAVWDSLDSDPGPFSFTGQVVAPDGSRRTYPVTIGRQMIPSFGTNMEQIALR